MVPELRCFGVAAKRQPDPVDQRERCERIEREASLTCPILSRNIFGGDSYRKLACDFRIPLGTIKSRIYSERRRLAKQL
jgi:hypothetical protein